MKKKGMRKGTKIVIGIGAGLVALLGYLASRVKAEETPETIILTPQDIDVVCEPSGKLGCLNYDLYKCENNTWVLREQNSSVCRYIAPEKICVPGEEQILEYCSDGTTVKKKRVCNISGIEWYETLYDCPEPIEETVETEYGWIPVYYYPSVGIPNVEVNYVNSMYNWFGDTYANLSGPQIEIVYSYPDGTTTRFYTKDKFIQTGGRGRSSKYMLPNCNPLVSETEEKPVCKGMNMKGLFYTPRANYFWVYPYVVLHNEIGAASYVMADVKNWWNVRPLMMEALLQNQFNVALYPVGELRDFVAWFNDTCEKFSDYLNDPSVVDDMKSWYIRNMWIQKKLLMSNSVIK